MERIWNQISQFIDFVDVHYQPQHRWLIMLLCIETEFHVFSNNNIHFTWCIPSYSGTFSRDYVSANTTPRTSSDFPNRKNIAEKAIFCLWNKTRSQIRSLLEKISFSIASLTSST